jgi:acetylglutamate kinase
MNDLDRLIATLPFWLARRNWRVVVKLGGSAMEEPPALAATLRDVAWLHLVGQRVVLVHGGGKPIDRALTNSGIVPRKVGGRRITDEATLAVVVRVLADEINPDLVKQLRDLGCPARGLRNTTDCILRGRPIPELGRAGEVTGVNTATLSQLMLDGAVPVVPPVGRDDANGWLNINADDAAASIAAHWQADALIYLTDTPGLLRDVNDVTSTIPHLTPKAVNELIADGTIAGGMAPKAQGCVAALHHGVGRVQILDGRVHHALLQEGFTGRCPGTEFSQ